MKNVMFAICSMLLVLVRAPAAPVIRQTANAFGLRPFTAHDGIARGGLLAILGDELGPEVEIAAEGDPDPALAGVSVVLNIHDTFYTLPIRSASRRRVVALVPAQVPSENGTVTVTYNGFSTRAAPVQIVDATFGIATQLETGFGPGFASNVSGDAATLNTLLNPARPGQRLMLYGTGLGVTGEPPVVWVGNFQANLIDAGPTGCCKGIDQIQIVIPEAIEGCYVPVAVQIGQTMSNFVSLAVASGDGPCSDPLSFTPEELERIRNVDKVRVGAITVDRNGADMAQAKFVEYERDAFLRSVSVFGMPPFGTCTVNPQFMLSFFTEPGSYMDERHLVEPNGLINRLLDAGPQLTATNVAGFFTLHPVINLTMQGGAGLYYGGFVDPFNPRGVEALNGGSLQVKGPGGRDVGAFQADQRFNTKPGPTSQSFNSSNWIPGEPSPQIFWTQGLDIPVEPPRYSEIQLIGGGLVMVCTVAPGIGRFQVPGFVTLGAALRNQDGAIYIQGLGPQIGLAYPPARFTAEGLDIGVFFSRSYK